MLTGGTPLLGCLSAVGNTTCYAYDALHRVTSITYPSGSYAGNTPTKTFVYDASSASGFNLSNTKGRLAEAYTGPSNNKTTDLVFSYSARGEVTDAYESTPHSSGYYHTTAAYWANGALNTLGGLPGMPSLTYNVEGEGRMSSVSDSTPQTLGTVAGYNVYGEATGLTFGSSDSDSFGFDANTGRMTQYQYSVGATPQTVTGNLTWKANGTLGQLAITDQLNPANTQACNYTHDDLVRLASVTCTNNTTNVWAQTFGYDPFGNLTKNLVSGYPGTSFTPTYGSTNRITSSPCTYDANGNTTQDNVHSYTWDAEGKALSADTISLTYDALGRMVEQNGTTQIVYAPTGQKFALMTGQTVVKAFVALPGGAQAVYSGTTLAYFRHADWLGSARLTTTTSRTVYSSLAYAPYGETYAESGTPDRSFTGQNQDTVAGGTAGLYDFMYRQHGQYGRWTSPDPAGFSAASPDTPQSWNRYAYVLNNPLSYIDPFGLYCVYYGYTDETLDGANFDFHSSDPECRENGGQWFDDPKTEITVSDTPPADVEVQVSDVGSIIPAAWKGGKSGAGNPANNVTKIITALQNCGAAGNAAAASAGNDLARMQATGHIQILPNVPANAAGNTTTPPLSIFGLQTPTIQVGPDVTASTLFHEWLHKTQIFGNPLGLAALGANKIQAKFNAQGEGFLDTQADRIAATILGQCKISD